MKTVYLVGAGMGNPGTLTMEAHRAIQSSQLLLGAARLLEPYAALPIPQKPLVRTKELSAEIHQSQAQIISVLFSGDLGFYSGANSLYDGLSDCKVITLPGISSVSYFCAKLQIAWQDVALFSAHGRACNVVGEVQTHAKSLFLTGGTQRVETLCQQLAQAGYGALAACAGERLSYPDERIVTGNVEQLSRERFQDLAVLLVENPAPIPVVPSVPALQDSQFQRERVPMTKEAVRLSVLAALQISESDVVWDVGAGTGSVSVACALAARKGTVYAVEQKPEAAALIAANKVRFGVTNLHIMEGIAPEALSELPPPDCVFIGGTSGHMAEIFEVVLEKNPAVRMVLTAVTLESLTEGLQCMKRLALEDVEITQLTAARARELGAYHLMAGENPVWILSGTGSKETSP